MAAKKKQPDRREQVNFSLPESLMVRLRAVSDETRVPMSRIVEDAVVAKLEEMRKK